MVPLILRCKGPNLAAIGVECHKVKVRFQRSNDGQFAGSDGACINLATDRLVPENLSLTVDSEYRTGLSGNQNMFLPHQRTCRDTGGGRRIIRFDWIPVLAAR